MVKGHLFHVKNLKIKMTFCSDFTQLSKRKTAKRITLQSLKSIGQSSNNIPKFTTKTLETSLGEHSQ